MQARYELTWPGKIDKKSIINSLVGGRPAKSLVKRRNGSGNAKWANQIHCGDNLQVCASLLEEFRGAIDLIYVDPPYGVGGSFKAREDDGLVRSKHAYFDPKISDENFDLQGIFSRLVVMRELLSKKGTLYLQSDWRLSAIFRMLLDEIFGRDCFLNHIVWTYKTGGVPVGRGFARKHDDILVYTKTKSPIFNPFKQKSYVRTLPEPHTASGKRLGVKRDSECDLCNSGSPGQKYRLVHARDVWDDIPALYRNDREIVGYDTQKPEKLLERIIRVSSNPDSIVADFYCGSGTTAVVAESLGRRWIACDSSNAAIKTLQKRLKLKKNSGQVRIIKLG